MMVGITREKQPGENRVALTPDLVARLAKAGHQVAIEPSAGEAAGFPDSAFQQAGAQLQPDVLSASDIILKVQPPSSDEISRIKEGATLIGLLQPAGNTQLFQQLAQRRISAFAMELMPRITRAQPMDALSAMSTVAGYKAVLLAANRLPRFFPLLMTAAGTITAAHVLIIGAGVAGLQAIGTAKRLGAIVEAYDTRPVVREQVESLGGRFVDLGLETKDAEASTGYAKAQSQEFYQQQQKALGKHVADSDVVITTALVPGKKAPILIPTEAARAMRPGSVIVDLAAEQGGNCELTQAGKEVVDHGVIIMGPMNLPATVPFHASQMYARTITSYLLHLTKDGRLNIDPGDDLTKGPLVTHDGKVLYPAASV
jgi:NAD(P) transhydrogenase subunit alpha